MKSEKYELIFVVVEKLISQNLILFTKMDTDDTDDYVLYIAVIAAYYKILRKRKRNNNKRLWVRPIYAARQQFGDFEHLFQELKEDSEMFFKYTRMNISTFYKLIDLLQPYLQKRSWRALPVEQRILIMLRYL